MLGTTLLPLLQALNSLEVLVFGILRIVAVEIDYSRLGWEDHDLLIVNQSRDTFDHMHPVPTGSQDHLGMPRSHHIVMPSKMAP